MKINGEPSKLKINKSSKEVSRPRPTPSSKPLLRVLAYKQAKDGIHHFIFGVNGAKPSQAPVYRLDVSEGSGIALGMDMPPKLNFRNPEIRDAAPDLSDARVRASTNLNFVSSTQWWKVADKIKKPDSPAAQRLVEDLNSKKKDAQPPLLCLVNLGNKKFPVHPNSLDLPQPEDTLLKPTPWIFNHFTNAIAASSKAIGLPSQSVEGIAKTIQRSHDAVIDNQARLVKQSAN